MVQFILDAVFNGIVWMIGLLPTIPIPSGLTDGISYVFGLLNTLGFILPLGTIANCLGIVLTVYAIKFLVSSTSYVARKIPTIS